MQLGSGEVVSATAVGVARLFFGNNYLVLNDVYYIPGFKRNLISISMLHEQLFNVSFSNNMIIISRNGFDILLVGEKIFCAPDQIGKTKHSGSDWYRIF